MHDGMPYNPIQGQGHGHRASEVPKIALLPPDAAMPARSWES